MSWMRLYKILFEKGFRETSQDFNSFSSFRQFLFSFFLSVDWLSWNFQRFLEILFQTDTKSFSFLSWKIRKFYSKKKIFWPLSISKQKSFVYWLNFPERFWPLSRVIWPLTFWTFCLSKMSVAPCSANCLTARDADSPNRNKWYSGRWEKPENKFEI